MESTRTVLVMLVVLALSEVLTSGLFMPWLKAIDVDIDRLYAIDYNYSQSHLLIEEALSERDDPMYQEAKRHLTHIQRALEALKASHFDLFFLIPIKIEHEIISHLQWDLHEMKALTAKRWNAPQTSIAGSEIDQAFDQFSSDIISDVGQMRKILLDLRLMIETFIFVISVFQISLAIIGVVAFLKYKNLFQR